MVEVKRNFEHTCIICGNAFMGVYNQVVCSGECRRKRQYMTYNARYELKHGGPRQIKLCKNCGDPLTVHQMLWCKREECQVVAREYRREYQHIYAITNKPWLYKSNPVKKYNRYILRDNGGYHTAKCGCITEKYNHFNCPKCKKRKTMGGMDEAYGFYYPDCGWNPKDGGV